jgi:hypothetical protein
VDAGGAAYVRPTTSQTVVDAMAQGDPSKQSPQRSEEKESSARASTVRRATA